MIHLHTTINQINYSTLADKLKQKLSGAETESSNLLLGLVLSLKKPISYVAGKLPEKLVVKGLKLSWKKISKQAESFGANLSEPLVTSSNQDFLKTEVSGMMNVSASIESIDYKKLLTAVDDAKSKPKVATDSHELAGEIIRIVKPFISETMSTIPTSAILQTSFIYALYKKRADMQGL